MRRHISALLWGLLALSAPISAQEENCSFCSQGYDCDCDNYLEEHCVHHLIRQQGRPDYCDPDSRMCYDHGSRWAWLPEDPPLFRPFVADPHPLTYSVGWRYNDNALSKNVIPVSFYDSIPFFRVCDLWRWRGALQFDLEGALWAVFDPCTYSSPLINADYYVSGTLTYAFCNWSFRLRYYHISSHIGDEYLLNHPDFDRRNPSAETLDFFVSNNITDSIRLYAGGGFVVNQDPSFKCGRGIFECGCEVRILHVLNFSDPCHGLCGHPLYAMHFRYRSDFDKHIDSTYLLGYEFTKCTGLRRMVRLYMEYHDGYSLEGQFCRKHTNYFSVNAAYGY